MTKLAHTIIGILFYESDSLTISELASFTRESEENVKSATNEIIAVYNTPDSSLNLLVHNDSYQFVLTGDARELVLEHDKQEREGELSRAALETLSTIIYLGQATKNEIDYIRGVQSSYMLRVLLSRGLIARGGNNTKTTRGTVYIPTIETLRYMGLDKITDMPDYEKIHNDLSAAANNSNIIPE